jgi:hypothetical protein
MTHVLAQTGKAEELVGFGQIQLLQYLGWKIV